MDIVVYQVEQVVPISDHSCLGFVFLGLVLINDYVEIDAILGSDVLMEFDLLLGLDLTVSNVGVAWVWA